MNTRRALILAAALGLLACAPTRVRLTDGARLEGHPRRGDGARRAFALQIPAAPEPRWVALDAVDTIEPPGRMPIVVGGGLAVLGAAAVALTRIQEELDGSGAASAGPLYVLGIAGGGAALLGGLITLLVASSHRNEALRALEEAGWRP